METSRKQDNEIDKELQILDESVDKKLKKINESE